MNTAIRLTLLVAGLACANFSLAASWYRVEVMLIAYTDDTQLDSENWPRQWQTPKAPSDIAEEALLHETDENDITEEITKNEVVNNDVTESEKTGIEKSEHDSTTAITKEYQWWLEPYTNQYNALLGNFQFQSMPKARWAVPLQPLSHLMLEDSLKHITPRSDMKVIWHQAWVEPIQEKAHSIIHPVEFELEDKGLKIQLSGEFDISISRYLHLHTRLNMQHSELSVNENEEAQWLPTRAAKIQQSRRMRSGELHYLDHPMLGVVIQIMPIKDTL